MSNKSGTDSQVISLPKGGGALQGLGESFSHDLHTGTGNFTVPIDLPPGRNGFQPELSLIYSTGNGNSAFGLGWRVSLPGISRKTSKGVPRYDNIKDVFILSGSEDLAPLPSQVSGRTRYRPRTEGLFARIEHAHDQASDHWEVRSKDGLVSFYGTPNSANSDPAVVADPADRTKVFAWKLTRTRDPFGNHILYEYERDHGEEGPHHWDQLYLKKIYYADYTGNSERQFLASVTFEYDPRPDPFSEYRPGFEIRTRKRCTRIETRTHAEPEHLVRTYHLVYLDQRPGMASSLPHNGTSLLSQIQVVGHDGERTEALPPLAFGYTHFAPEQRDLSPLQGIALPTHSLGSPELELADLFGNGLPDILEMNGTTRYWRNLGDGTYDLPREMPEAPAGFRLADPGVQMLDADGDGRIDLLVTTDTVSGYFPLRFDGLWDQHSFQRYALAPSVNLEDPEVRLVDVDGDGVTDVIHADNRFEYFFNDPHQGWHETRHVERRDLEEFPNLTFSDPRVKLADMSGDGLQDMVLAYDGCVAYWPALGHGDWAKRVTMQHNPRFPYGYDPRRILLGDVDGDGLADLVYIDDTTVTVWINQSGNRWSDPIEIQGTPPVSDIDAVRLTDMLGTGVSGIVWSSDADSQSRHHLFFLDVTSGTKPYLLNEMTNHMGAVTRVQYAPSTRFYVADEQQPETRWKTPLPFPVQVVARVEVIDALSSGKLTTEYTYHHGYWDGAEREFRGFGRVDQRDTEVFEDYHAPGLHPERSFEAVSIQTFSPPTETRTWFHQGPIGDAFGDWEEIDYRAEYWSGDPTGLERPAAMDAFLQSLPRRAKRDALRALRGSILRTELYALDGSARQDRPYTVTESLYGIREESPPGAEETDRLSIFFPHVLAQRSTQWERGSDPMTQFTFTEHYDSFGQPRSQSSIAVPRGRDYRVTAAPGEPYLVTHTVTDYTEPPLSQSPYIADRVARTTHYEVLNDGAPSVFALQDRIRDGSATRHIIGQTLNFYDGLAFEGLPWGQAGAYGALSRTERLVLTDDILHEVYKSGSTIQNPPEIPPYLVPGHSPAWTAEYPQEFRDLLPPLAGYVYHPEDASSEYANGYFVMTERRRSDYHEDPEGKGRGLLTATRDPLGHDTTINYDVYDLLPTEVTDPANLTTRATYDYRVMQPQEVTDPNGNRTTSVFTPLGLLERTAVMSKAGENVGDTLDVPGSLFAYDFMAFTERQQPISVRMIQRIHHVHDTDVPLPKRDETIETVAYSDGFGRLLQTRTQAEDTTFGDPIFGDAGLPTDQTLPVGDAVGQPQVAQEPPRVVVSGWQSYNNKGQVVETYEPFFSVGFNYTPPAHTELGQKTTMFYDPRGQVIRTAHPDASEQRIILGVPHNLASPEQFVPTPWEAYTYDANDNAERTHGTGDPIHWNTPASLVVDALGRTIQTVERNGPDPAADWYMTRSSYDIQGNLLTVTDALDRLAFTYVYDLADNALRTESIDSGTQRTILDPRGNNIEQRDSKGALLLPAYDALSRPIRMWARDAAGEAVTLRERLIYGDSAAAGLTSTQAQNANLLGTRYKHFDEAGCVTLATYDFKGNVLEKTRQVISDATILSVFDPPPANWQISAFRVDWQPPHGTSPEAHANALLDAVEYRTSASYDAINRIKTLHYPQDVEGARQALRPHYNRAGGLERVELDGTTYVEHIAYNAKGQRVLIAYGNGVMTRYAYDPQTFRLARVRTERYTTPTPLTYQPTGTPLQDCAYTYDLTGNINTIHDRTPNSGIPNSPLGDQALDRIFTYDPLYRLLSATGRECDQPPGPPPWDDQPRCTDLTRTRGYSEHYQYDAAGNMLRLQHQTQDNGFTRQFNHTATNNRLESVTLGATNYAYTYDANGNLIHETTSRHFEWDHSSHMRAFRTQAGNSEPSVYTHYVYDGDGMKVKKLVRKQGGRVEVTVYIDGMFEYHRILQGAVLQENNTLHVMDDQSRLALIRIGTPFSGDTTPAVTYHLGDHLGSSQVVIDETGALINREEYTPYGETSFGSFAKKRYRFTGKERDEESGLYDHGARYYAPWLVRWVSCDPLGPVDGLNLYQYVRNNPLTFTDPTGTQASDAESTATAGADEHGLYWHYESGGSARLHNGAYWYYPSGSEKASHVWDGGQWAHWVEAGETIVVTGKTPKTQVPLPAIDHSLYVPEGVLYRQYAAAKKAAENSNNSWWTRAISFGLATLVAPIAWAEEYVGRPVANVPYYADLGGQLIARGSLQNNTNNKIEDYSQGVGSLAQGFTAAASVVTPTALRTPPPGRRAPDKVAKAFAKWLDNEKVPDNIANELLRAEGLMTPKPTSGRTYLRPKVGYKDPTLPQGPRPIPESSSPYRPLYKKNQL